MLGGRQCASGNVTHTTTHFNGIGSHHSILALAGVGDGEHILVPALLERECAEIHPHASRHALIHGEGAGDAAGVHNILGIVHAVGERLVRNIEGEIAIFRHIHIVGGFGEFAFLHRFHHSGGAIGERILKILVGGLLVGKTHAGISPCLLAALFSVGVLGEVAIIIHNHFHRVNITLTRVKHVGTSIFEHRHHIGKHITHGVKVLDGLEQARALPFPAVDFWLVVQAVAVPHGYQIAIKCLGVAARRTHFGDKWFVLAHKLLREGVKILFHIVAIHGDIHLLHFGIMGKLGFDASLQFATIRA